MQPKRPILVFSHLRWDFVYQRPQHLLSRLARDRRVIFVEETLRTRGEAYWEKSSPEPNLLVCKPYTPVDAGGFDAPQVSLLTLMVKELIEQEELLDYVVWLYTPMALPVVLSLQPAALVYDCMDELSAFSGAPRQLRELESELLKHADLVFTGGPSLFRAKQSKHHSVHCFPSSVDAAHFSQALRAVDPPDQAHIPHPRLGFYGVIDERVDLALLQSIATAHPEWQLVMVGPTAKIDIAKLPDHPNIHYLGRKSYAELPSYLSGWDVCLLPFALNESTRFISPTKILEYMVAELPIVSTPIADVAGPYGEIVYLGTTPGEFVRACEQALAATPEEVCTRAAKMRCVLAGTSWDRTAAAMDALIEQAVRANLDSRSPSSLIPTRRGHAIIPNGQVGAAGQLASD